MTHSALPRNFTAFRGWVFVPFLGAPLIRVSFTLPAPSMFLIQQNVIFASKKSLRFRRRAHPLVDRLSRSGLKVLVLFLFYKKKEQRYFTPILTKMQRGGPTKPVVFFLNFTSCSLISVGKWCRLNQLNKNFTIGGCYHGVYICTVSGER